MHAVADNDDYFDTFYWTPARPAEEAETVEPLRAAVAARHDRKSFVFLAAGAFDGLDAAPCGFLECAENPEGEVCGVFCADLETVAGPVWTRLRQGEEAMAGVHRALVERGLL